MCDINSLNKNYKYALDILSESEFRLTPKALNKKIIEKAGISTSAAKKVIRELINKGEISYTYMFGSTYVELSFLKPVNITEHFTLKPWSRGNSSKKTDIDIIIDPGISFGSGRHPTTRLCLEAIDQLFFKKKLLKQNKKLKAADIGTGSGVLAIATVKAGIEHCLAIDTDPNALAEAQRNIRLNRLEKAIHVRNVEINVKEDQKFSLVCANLRFPTLKRLCPLFSTITEKNSFLVMSGIRTWETDDLLCLYLNQGFKCIHREDAKNWSGLILHRHV